MHIGVAGLGRKGAAMALRLQEAGKDVTVWDRSRAKANATGLRVAKNP